MAEGGSFNFDGRGSLSDSDLEEDSCSDDGKLISGTVKVKWMEDYI